GADADSQGSDVMKDRPASVAGRVLLLSAVWAALTMALEIAVLPPIMLNPTRSTSWVAGAGAFLFRFSLSRFVSYVPMAAFAVVVAPRLPLGLILLATPFVAVGSAALVLILRQALLAAHVTLGGLLMLGFPGGHFYNALAYTSWLLLACGSGLVWFCVL